MRLPSPTAVLAITFHETRNFQSLRRRLAPDSHHATVVVMDQTTPEHEDPWHLLFLIFWQSN